MYMPLPLSPSSLHAIFWYTYNICFLFLPFSLSLESILSLSRHIVQNATFLYWSDQWMRELYRDALQLLGMHIKRECFLHLLSPNASWPLGMDASKLELPPSNLDKSINTLVFHACITLWVNCRFSSRWSNTHPGWTFKNALQILVACMQSFSASIAHHYL